MSIDKKMNYEIQAGVKNYKPSEMVTVPKTAKSSPTHPTAHLAYITDAEQKLLIKKNLHGSLKGGKPNKGPGGIPSLQGDFGGPGGFGGFQGGGDYSSAETGNTAGFSGYSGPELPPGVDPKGSEDAQEIRDAFIAAGGGQRVNPGFFDSRNRISRAELARARAFNPTAFSRNRRGGIMDLFTGGGFLGNILRGLGQRLGLGKRFNEPTYDMSEFSAYGLGGSQNPVYYDDFDNTGLLSLVEDINKSKSEDDDYDPIFDNALMAKIATNSPALAQLRSLQKKQVLSNMGGPEFTIEDQQKLDQLEEMEADPVNVYSQTV